MRERRAGRLNRASPGPVLKPIQQAADERALARMPHNGDIMTTCLMFVFNTVLGEELLFRGLLLPRMRAFGRADWLVNGLLFACYHLHVPWVIPQTVLVDTFALALPSRRYRSSLIAIAAHSAQTVFFIVIALALVLR